MSRSRAAHSRPRPRSIRPDRPPDLGIGDRRLEPQAGTTTLGRPRHVLVVPDVLDPPAGTVTASGSGLVAQCGIVASAIEITGAHGSATLGARCLG
jgi:hypothetical protein